jgi:hypothetical protein
MPILRGVQIVSDGGAVTVVEDAVGTDVET